MLTPELLARINRAIDELTAIRDAIAGAPAGELTADDEREIADLVARRAARMRRAAGGGK